LKEQSPLSKFQKEQHKQRMGKLLLTVVLFGLAGKTFAQNLMGLALFG
jgi:hypothetical protein